VSRAYGTSLGVTVALILAARFVFRALPLRRVAARVGVFDVALIGVGVLGLAFHCGAMFFRHTTERLPGAHSAIRAINALGTTSRLWFIVPALLVVIGLRRQYPVVVLVVAVALVAVGVTMYDHGPLRTHLRAIFVAVVVLATVVSAFLVPPWRHVALPGHAQGGDTS
jgi:hypothetical protein